MADVKVQSRYSTTYTTPMSDSQVTMDVAVAPANTKGFLTIRYGYSDQEDVYYANIAALQLTGLLRGLSPTALTPTEVVGLKKAHTINAPTTLNTVKMMTVHYVINNKPNVDGDETISGNWSFTISPILPGLKSAAGYQVITTTNEATPVNYLDIKASATGATVKLTATGSDTNVNAEFLCKGSGVVTLPDLSALKTSAAPTADNHIANKKYVDDKISLAEATTVQVGTQVETTAGARNYINPKSTVKTPATYTPAYLTGDNTAEGNYLLWLGTSDGSFAITIDGVSRTISGIDFTVGGLTSMALLAAHIQTALRAVTGGLETVAWSTDHFIISSANTTSSSAITVTSATGSGTDISGAGGFGGLGCDVGHGTVTAKVLNLAADENKIPIIGATGQISPFNTPLPAAITADAAELNKLDGTSANVTAANLNTLTAGAGSDASQLHIHPTPNIIKPCCNISEFTCIADTSATYSVDSSGLAVLNASTASSPHYVKILSATIGGGALPVVYENGLQYKFKGNALMYNVVGTTSQLYTGIGQITQGSGGHTFTDEHIGLKCVWASISSVEVYATCATGGVESTSLLETITLGAGVNCQMLEFMFFYTPTAVYFKYRRPYTSLTWITATISTHIPSSGTTASLMSSLWISHNSTSSGWAGIRLVEVLTP